MHVQKINSKIEVTQESRVICYWSDSDEEFGIIHESRWKKTYIMIFKIFLVKGDLNLNLSFILREFFHRTVPDIGSPANPGLGVQERHI